MPETHPSPHRIAIALWLLAAAPVVAAPAIGDLGDSLLDSDLARQLAPAKPEAAPAPQERRLLPDGDALQRLIERGAREAAGEDVGRSPLNEVVNAMRRAEALITNEAKDRVAVPAQREAVTHLDRLIAQMEKQCNCQGGGSKPSSRSGRQKSRRTQSKPSESQQATQSQQSQQGKKPGDEKKPGKPSAKPGGDPRGVESSLAGSAGDASPANQQELMKAAWGHLPERLREQMLQGPGEEFLPAYREELRQYYRRLAERSAEEAP